MKNQNSEIQLFVKEWANELSRSIEMFTGDKAAVEYKDRPEEDSSADFASHLWWKQTFDCAAQFACWIGAPESAWTVLGGAVTSAGGQTQRAWFDILTRACQSAAESVSRRLSLRISAGAGSTDALPALTGMMVFEIPVAFRAENLSLVMAVESQAAQALAGGHATDVQVARIAEQAYAPMLQRLMDLDLPLSITLGRAVLPVRDVLKLASGSLVELDRNVGEYVDLVVHGTVVARGEVVSVKGNYGVRIKEIISRQDRLALHNNA